MTRQDHHAATARPGAGRGAMAALGLTTHVSALRRAGAAPLLLALLLFVWLLAGGLALTRAINCLW